MSSPNKIEFFRSKTGLTTEPPVQDPAIATFPGREKYNPELLEAIINHPIIVENDPRSPTLLRIAENRELAGDDFRSILEGLTAWAELSSFGTHPDNYDTFATFLLENVGPNNSKKFGELLGSYETSCGKPIVSQDLKEIGDSWRHLASMWARKTTSGHSRLCGGWHILTALLDKNAETNSNLPPNMLSKYLSAIASSLKEKSSQCDMKNRVDPDRETRSLVVVIAFIKRQNELIPIATLQKFLTRLSELPSTGQEYPGQSTAEQYENYQGQVGNPLLSEDEHNFIVKGLQRTEQNNLSAGIELLRGLGELSKCLGREFTQPEQAQILAIQTGASKGSLFESNPFRRLAKGDLELLPVRLQIAGAVSAATSGYRIDEVIKQLDNYIDWLKQSGLSGPDRNDRLASLFFTIKEKGFSEGYSCFISSIAKIDSRTAPMLSAEEFSTLAAHLNELDRGGKKSKAILDGLTDFAQATRFSLRGSRLFAVEALLSANLDRLVNRGHVGNDLHALIGRVHDCETELNAPLSDAQLGAIAELCKWDDNSRQAPLSSREIFFLFTFIRHISIDKDLDAVKECKAQWHSLIGNQENWGLPDYISDFEIHLTKFDPREVKLSDLVHARNLLEPHRLSSDERSFVMTKVLESTAADISNFRSLRAADITIK